MTRTDAVMGTLVTVNLLGEFPPKTVEDALNRALEWFHCLEATCSRFDPHSELMRLAASAGRPVPVSDALLRAVQFALAVAEASGGAFDPTVGAAMAARGFNREHRSGQPLAAGDPSPAVSFRDVRVDAARATITLTRPLTLDLGAVVKGLAIDLAARELHPFRHFAIDAGGDLFLGGCNPQGEPWAVGIRDPAAPEAVIATVRVSDRAVCTSGAYERGQHILDARTGNPVLDCASATVIAPTAMAADALATAAFALGPATGIAWLQQQGVEGLLLASNGARHSTRGFNGEFHP